MTDQIIIGDKASFDDFGATVAQRANKPPQKKAIRETVPHSNKTYDFSAINGEIYWEERQLEYTLEMIAPTAEKLMEMETALANWLMLVTEQELHDPIIPDHHYVVTYSDMTFEDDEGLCKTTVKVTFAAYPYKIANIAKVFEVTLPAQSQQLCYVQNDSCHRVTPTIVCNGNISIRHNGWFDFEAGTTKDEVFKIAAGLVSMALFNNEDTDVTVTISFNEEVF